MKKPKKKFKLARRHDTKHLGEEPIGIDYTAIGCDPITLMTTMKWYSYFGDAASSLNWAREHAEKHHPELMEQLGEIEPVMFSHIITTGHRCRILSRGGVLPDHAMRAIDENFSRLPELLAKQAEKNEKRGAPRKRIPAIDLMIDDVDHDMSTFNGDPKIVDLRGFALKRNVSAGQLLELGPRYAPLLEEIDEMLGIDDRSVAKDMAKREKLLAKLEALVNQAESGRLDTLRRKAVERQIFDLEGEIGELHDSNMKSQLLEGYAWLDRLGSKAKTRYRDMIKSIVDGVGFVVKAKKAERDAIKPPKPARSLSPEKQTAHMRYKREEPDLKLVSLHPSKMIGKKSVWAWHSKYKKIIHWTSFDGFGAAGQSLKSVSETIARTVRKPEEFFRDFPGNGKHRQLMFDSLKTTTHVSTPRMSDEVMVLYAE